MSSDRNSIIRVSDILLILEILARSLLIEIAMAFVSVDRIAKFLSQKRSWIIPSRDPSKIKKAAHFSAAIDRRLFRQGTCLRSSLVLFWMFNQVTLHIGVQKKDKALDGHAWIEKNGEIFSTTLNTDTYDPIWKYEKSV